MCLMLPLVLGDCTLDGRHYIAEPFHTSPKLNPDPYPSCFLRHLSAIRAMARIRIPLIVGP